MTIVPSHEILEIFPTEIMTSIFSHLSPKDLLRCSQVNKTWQLIANDFLEELEDPRGTRYPVYTRDELMIKIRKVGQQLHLNQNLRLYIRPFRKKNTPQLFLDLSLYIRAARRFHYNRKSPDIILLMALDEIGPTVIGVPAIRNHLGIREARTESYAYEAQRTASVNVFNDFSEDIDNVLQQRENELFESCVNSTNNSEKLIKYSMTIVTVMLLALYVLFQTQPNSDSV